MDFARQISGEDGREHDNKKRRNKRKIMKRKRRLYFHVPGIKVPTA
jgi:hypothetical protein